MLEWFWISLFSCFRHQTRHEIEKRNCIISRIFLFAELIYKLNCFAMHVIIHFFGWKQDFWLFAYLYNLVLTMYRTHLSIIFFSVLFNSFACAFLLFYFKEGETRWSQIPFFSRLFIERAGFTCVFKFFWQNIYWEKI